MKLVRKITIRNELGLHMRPATEIIKLLRNSHSSVFFSYKDKKINARSIMSILMLVAKKDNILEIIVDGEDAEITMNRLVKAFETCFGEKT